MARQEERETKPLWSRVRSLDGTEKIKSLPWLVKGIIPESSVGFFAGQSGAYKTFGLLGLAGSIISGDDWHGYQIKRRGGVVYLAYEGEYTVDERIAAVAHETGRLEPPMIVPEEPDQLGYEESMESLEESLRAESRIMEEDYGVPLVCVMIDTVAAAGLIPADKENDPGAWAWVFLKLSRIAKRLKLAFILCHHAGKDAAAGLRGSSGAKAGADFIITMSAERDEISGEATNRFLHVSKTRRGGEGTIGAVTGKTVLVGIDEDGEDITTLVLEVDRGAEYVPAEGKSGKQKSAGKTAKPTKAQQNGEAVADVVRQLFEKHNAEAESEGAAFSGPITLVPRAEIVRELKLIYKSVTWHGEVVTRAINYACDKGLIKSGVMDKNSYKPL